MTLDENGFRKRTAFTMGCAVEREWTADQLAAWSGFVGAAARIGRAHDDELEAKHGLSISMIGLLGRLAVIDEQTSRLTDLATVLGLSLARVSRIVDVLERRGLVERVRCPFDARSVNARLTSTGLTVAREAQATVRAAVSATSSGP